MSLQTLELLKIGFSFIGGATGAGLTNILVAKWIERRELRAKQRQTRWFPFLEAARDLEARLADLQKKYENIPPNKVWRKVDDRTLPTWARDFHELYTFNKNPDPITNFESADVSPDEARKDDPLVQSVRIRMGHQLTYAASTLYMTAKYLGYAQRVRRDLNAGRLDLRKSGTSAQKIKSLLDKVRTELHGTSKEHPGAGIILEQQDFIGESMWTVDNDVIGFFEFQSRLVKSPGWEQFTDLFRFYLGVDQKLATEVELTKKELGELSKELEKMPGSR